ncbi:MAG: hypothetical protein DMG31_08765, partial [Acidobacteria bacterium]
RAANGRRIARWVSTFMIKSMNLFAQRLCQIGANVSFFTYEVPHRSPALTSRRKANLQFQ